MATVTSTIKIGPANHGRLMTLRAVKRTSATT